MKRALFILASVLMFFTSCSKEDATSSDYCPDLYLGVFSMKDSSHSLEIYSQSQVLKFRNAINGHMEVKAQEVTQNLEFGQGIGTASCEYVANYRRSYRYLFEVWLASLVTADHSLTIQYFLTCSPQYGDPILFSDQLAVTMLRDPTTISTVRSVHMIVDPRSQTDDYLRSFNQPGSSVTLLGRTFENVYASSDSGLFVTRAEGLVAFRDLANILWVLE